MGNFKDKNKKKIKRKKGKKFVYKNNSVLNKKEEKINPFEAVSNKKFMKHGKKYDNLINEYDSRYNTNSFIDNRIGEKSKSLSYDDKMKLRFKAQQLINMKNKKNKFSIMNEEGDEDLLTHKGKNLNELNLIDDDDNDKSEDEFYENMDNYMEEMDKNKGKLSRKEIIQNIIAKSKAFKEEKQRMKQSNIEKIQLLDETFSEISSLLKKRARSYSKYNDDYDRFAGSFLNTQNKTHPTDRIKSELEIAYEKERELVKLNKKLIREEEDEDEVVEKNYSIEENEVDRKKLTKKERIEKLINDRLKKGEKINKDDIVSKRRNKGDDEEEKEHESNKDEDNMSDLNEFDNKDEDDYDDAEEDGEDFDDFDEDGEDFGEDLENDFEDNDNF